MRNSPIQLLLDEHTIISSLEDVIKSIKNNWKNDTDKYKKDVSNILIFLREYSDHFHHFKEDKVLFPEIKNHPDFIYQEIVEGLEQHHELFRENHAKTTKALAENKYEEVQKILESNMNDLLDHIAVENDELFMMAETLFKENELERIYFKFKDIDMELGIDNKNNLANSIKKIPD
ncbi:MAG: hypothetical protein AUJ98_07815 [Bacteroidetes bacterium CG2_30_33_31]|nr:MAG: hypothetical protein AUJ98_07815 [Bacteroidetes bacterium CG2_30_33_31]